MLTTNTSNIRPLAKITRTGKMPIPQELFFLVGWASCPSNKFMKRTFARGLFSPAGVETAAGLRENETALGGEGESGA